VAQMVSVDVNTNDNVGVTSLNLTVDGTPAGKQKDKALLPHTGLTRGTVGVRTSCLALGGFGEPMHRPLIRIGSLQTG
jgi:hypothetical protein